MIKAFPDNRIEVYDDAGRVSPEVEWLILNIIHGATELEYQRRVWMYLALGGLAIGILLVVLIGA